METNQRPEGQPPKMHWKDPGIHATLSFKRMSRLLSGPGSSPGRGHCVVFLGKTLYSHSASLHPVVQMDTGEFNAGGNSAMD